VPNRSLIRVLGLVVILVVLYGIIPSGPLRFIWYGNGIDRGSGGDFAGIIALYSIAIGLNIVFIRSAAAVCEHLEVDSETDAVEEPADAPEDFVNWFHLSRRDRN